MPPDEMSLLRSILEYRVSFGQHEYWYSLQCLQTPTKNSSTHACSLARQAVNADQGALGPDAGWLSVEQSCSSMPTCCLEDIPASAFETVIRKVHPQDLASLRLVSRSISKRTTENVPSIGIFLCGSSSMNQLQQWRHATRHMQHAKGVVVRIHHEVPPDVFECSMKMLSECMNITTLCLHAVSSDKSGSDSKAHVFDLMPILSLLDRLESLSIEGIWFNRLEYELQHLAAHAAAGARWPLKRLVLKAEWDTTNIPEMEACFLDLWQDGAAALMAITTAFPQLEDLTITIPNLDYSDTSHSPNFDIPDDERSPVTMDPHTAVQMAQVAVVAAMANAVLNMKNLNVVSVSDLPDIWCPTLRLSTLAPSAAATAAMLPTSSARFVDRYLDEGTLKATKSTATTFKTLDEFGQWLLQQHHTLTCLRLETTGFYGGTHMTWNKQRPPPPPPQQQQQSNRETPTATHTSNGSRPQASLYKPAAAAATVELYYAADRIYPCYQSDAADSNINPGSDNPLVDSIICRLSPFCCRPAVDLLHTISNLRLDLSVDKLRRLADLVADLKTLKHFEVRILDAMMWGCVDRHSIKSALTAAAAVRDLQSLKVLTYHGEHELPHDLLLALAAAAVGPGNCLTSLELAGNFVTAEVAATAEETIAESPHAEADNMNMHTGTLFACQDVMQQADDSFEVLGDSGAHLVTLSSNSAEAVYSDESHNSNLTAVAASTGAGAGLSETVQMTHQQTQQLQQFQAAAAPADHLPAWHHALRQLTGLLELTITHTGSDYLRLPSEHLPTSLEVLRCSRLVLSDASAAYVAATAAMNHTDACTNPNRPAASACSTTFSAAMVSTPHQDPEPGVIQTACPRLLSLHLTECAIDDLRRLASHRLQHLTAVDSTWSGGWAAAAGAWPNVRDLALWYGAPVDEDQVHLSYDNCAAVTSGERSRMTACDGSSVSTGTMGRWSSSFTHSREAGMPSTTAEVS